MILLRRQQTVTFDDIIRKGRQWQLLKQIRRFASDVVLGGAFSNLLDQFNRLVVPGTRCFNGHRIKHMGPGQLVVLGHLVIGCQIGCSACLWCSECASSTILH